MEETSMISAAVMAEPDRPIEVRTFDRPTLELGAVLLRTLGSEVCGTDVHLTKGQLAGVPYPIIPGHVSVGVVDQIGTGPGVEAVGDVNGDPLELGEIVTFLDVYGNCGRCWYCTVGHATTRCPSRKVYGVTLSANDGLLGGWAEYVYLRPGVHIVPLPDELDWRAFLAGGCGMPTALQPSHSARSTSATPSWSRAPALWGCPRQSWPSSAAQGESSSSEAPRSDWLLPAHSGQIPPSTSRRPQLTSA